MRLEQLSPAHVRRAVDLYNAHAWPEGEEGSPRVRGEDLLGAKDLGELFERFERPEDPDPESDEAGAPRLRRYALRLGNHRYPFMKFVVQEFLVTGEFFFSVDTHDRLDVRPGMPDYEAWEELKVYNRDLRAEIEADWNAAGLPTNEDLRALMEELALIEREGSKRKRILVVDDETNVALGLQALLRARGYEVELAGDGRVGLERLAEDPVPDLVLLDYEMPELDGEEVLRRIRRDERLADLPVLLATASDIDLGRLQRVSGFLRKPYPRHVLFAMISRLLDEAGTDA